MTDTKKTQARISCRVQPGLKERVEAASRLTGLTLTSFVEVALSEKAEAVLAQEERILLSQRAFEEFLKALETPVAPSPKALEAVQRYKQKPAP